MLLGGVFETEQTKSEAGAIASLFGGLEEKQEQLSNNDS
jgi:hypothetical protein